MEIGLIDAGLESSIERDRWAAAEAAGELIAERPWDAWGVVLRHGISSDEDTRTAVATCVLEHLLESHFETFFPLLEAEIRGGQKLLADTFTRGWKFGEAEMPINSERWDKLVAELTRLE